jgi:hypothetical protein
MKVFDVLGPERVRFGLRSIGHTWADCFISRAVNQGEPFPADTIPRSLRAIGYFLRGMTGIAPGTVYEVVRAWDRDEVGFRALAEEWLAAQSSPAHSLQQELATCST